VPFRGVAKSKSWIVLPLFTTLNVTSAPRGTAVLDSLNLNSVAVTLSLGRGFEARVRVA
jgi:hypothetical protein